MEYRTAGAFFWGGLLFLAGLRLAAEPAVAELDALFAGTWTDAETLTTRGELRLGLNPAQLDFRLLELSRFSADGADAPGEARFFPGIYHAASGSRLLYGPLRTQGLATRLSRPWNRSPAYAENRPASGADLDTEATPSRAGTAYLALGTSRAAPVRMYLNTSVEANEYAQFIAGAEGHAGPAAYSRFEALYSRRDLDARVPDTWFSEEPPLPARDSSLYALGFLLRGPSLALAADGALDATVAEGYGSYGNLALRYGDDVWTASAAVDGADQRFRGSDGELVGQALRAALKIERILKEEALVRIVVLRQAKASAEELSTVDFAFRWPTPRKEHALQPYSLGLAWKRENSGATTDTASASFSADLGPLRTLISASSLIGPANTHLESCRAAVYSRFRFFQFRGALGSRCREGEPPAYDASLSLGLDGPIGSLSLRLAADPAPGPVSWTFAWRLAGGFP